MQLILSILYLRLNLIKYLLAQIRYKLNDNIKLLLSYNNYYYYVNDRNINYDALPLNVQDTYVIICVALIREFIIIGYYRYCHVIACKIYYVNLRCVHSTMLRFILLKRNWNARKEGSATAGLKKTQFFVIYNVPWTW